MNRTIKLAGWCVAATMFMSLMSGCASPAFTAASLPMEYNAPPPYSASKINLTGFASPRESIENIQPGDALDVLVATGIEEREPTTWALRVGDDGMVNVPIVGSVPVAGVPLTEAQSRIRTEAIRRGKYVSPNVTVAFQKRRSHRVTVMGEVNQPNTYELPIASSDLLTALSMAQGLTPDADTMVDIRHTSNGNIAQAAYNPNAPAPDKAYRVDLTRTEELPREAMELHDGSVIVVKKKDPRTVNVIGLVHRPGIYKMPEDKDFCVLDAIGDAGGLTMSVANRVHIIRQVAGQSQPITIGTTVQSAKAGDGNLRLAPGDIVSVEETAATVVVGTITTFFRVGFTSAFPGL